MFFVTSVEDAGREIDKRFAIGGYVRGFRGGMHHVTDRRQFRPEDRLHSAINKAALVPRVLVRVVCSPRNTLASSVIKVARGRVGESQDPLLTVSLQAVLLGFIEAMTLDVFFPLMWASRWCGSSAMNEYWVSSTAPQL